MIKAISIRNKFIMVAIFILIVLISFSFFLISLINQLANVTSEIIDHPLEVSNAASYANVEVLRMHRDLKEILLVDKDYEVNILVDRIRVSEGKVYVALDTIAYDILGSEGKKLQEEARIMFDEWKDIRSEMIGYVRNNEFDEALELTRQKGANHIDSLERKLLELNQYARKKAESFQDNSITLEKNTESTAIWGIIWVLMIVFLTIYWMSWSVLGGIGSLSESLNKIIESGEFSSVTLSGNDELTELSTIFNELVYSLGNQLWVKAGNQKLNNVLNQEEDIATIVPKYLDELVDYGDFLSVAYYHREGEILNLLASVNAMSFYETQYSVGKKHIGECAKYNLAKTITYDHINEFDLPYQEIRVIPVSYKDEVFGVMCLVLKKEMSQETQELVNVSIKDYSIFIATYEQRRKIDLLFDESIRANEELINRQISLEENQEELETANHTLQEQRDLLNVKTSELEKQNTELVDLREELVKKYKDLESVTKYRGQFLTNISHELRTPLNSIVVLSNMLKDKNFKEFDEDDAEKVAVITKAANELLLTINDILDLSKIESGTVALDEVAFESSSLLGEWEAIYSPLLEDKGLEGRFIDFYSGQIYADKMKISHIVTNFISNAIKFTESGAIDVLVKSTEDVDYPIEISVVDSGIGIPQEKLEDIFDEFVQTDGSISRLYGGTGLGLAICKNNARLINGRINVISKLGYGSTFSISLPSASILSNYSADKASDGSTDSDKENLKNRQELNSKHKGKRILLCDDEPMNVFALSAMLEDIGVEPIAALSYQEAQEAFDKTIDIRMVLMDYMMPEVDGFTAIDNLKKSKGWDETPIAIITAADMEADKIEIIRKEGYVLVRKPIVYNEIVKLLNENL